MPNAFQILLAGQDISNHVQWLPDPNGGNIPNAQPVKIDSTLGQGAGTGGSTSGRSAQATFLTRLPMAQAIGAGQPLPIPTNNLYSPQQSDIENSNLAGFSAALGATGGIRQDSSQAWHGSSSLMVVSDASYNYQEITNSIPIASFTPGATYTFSVYLKMASGQAPALRFYVEANDNLAGNTAVGSVGTIYPSGTAWTRYQTTVTLPSSFPTSPAWTELGLRIDTGGTPQAVTFWADGYQCEQANAASPWALGSSTPLPVLVRQGEVIIKDTSGTTIFGGYVGKLDDATWRNQPFTQVSCYDYWQALAKATINEVFDGVSDIAAIRTLITKYAPWVDLSQLPSYPSGTLLGQVWRNKTLQWGIQHIADITGRQVYITPNRQLIYVSPTSAQLAPFALSDTPDFFSSFPHLISQYTQDDTQIINRVTLFGGKKPTPDFNQDVSTQANGSNTVFMLAYYPRKSSNGKVVVTVNGAVLTLGYALGTGAANLLHSQGGSCDVLLNADARTLTFDVAPAAGASVICTYRYQLPLIIQLTEKNSYAFYGSYYDGVISDETVVDSATAIQRCRVLLLEQAYGLTSIQLKCWKGGLQAGQQLQLYNAVRGINNLYVVQEVQATPVTPFDVEYTVTLGAWNWNLVDVLQNLAVRTAGQDLADQETVTPTQVNVANAVAGIHAITFTPTTRSMAKYSPGLAVGATGVMYPGLSTV